MSDHHDPQIDSEARGTSHRGQSLVEFALVLPMLLVLLLGITDFGRVFSAGITAEAMARDAAEAASQEYLQQRRAAAGPPDATAYALVHERAHEVACEEAKTLPNHAASGGACTMPVIGSCIHDEWGDHCSTPPGAPASCTTMTAWPPPLEPSGGLPYVQVNVCYRFTTIVNLSDLRLPLGWSLSIGDMWLQRERVFVVADY